MSLPPTILRSASMATLAGQLQEGPVAELDARYVEYPPAGAGTVVGLSKMTMMPASFR
jgi:hypothetical protein